MSRRKGVESYKRAVFSSTAFMEFETRQGVKKNLSFETVKAEDFVLDEGSGSTIEEERDGCESSSLTAIRLARTFEFDNLKIKLHLGEEANSPEDRETGSHLSENTNMLNATVNVEDVEKNSTEDKASESSIAENDSNESSANSKDCVAIISEVNNSILHEMPLEDQSTTDGNVSDYNTQHNKESSSNSRYNKGGSQQNNKDNTTDANVDAPASFSSSDNEFSSLEFPDSSDTSLIDWDSIVPIITFVQSMFSERKKEPKRDSLDTTVFFDPRYLYFLKKVCGLSKKECVAYGKEQYKLLGERANKSKAEIPPVKGYSVLNEPEGATITIEGNKIPVTLRRIEKIQPIELPTYVKDEFEYLVYKYGENVEMISRKMEIDIRDVILIYYMKYYNVPIEMTGSLLDKYVDEEWNMNDRIMFEENFNKHGTKFNKFMMNKSVEELRIYYRFYLKNYLPINWTPEERGQFARLVGVYRKDWEAMSSHFETSGKNANDLRVFYGSYFKKLDEEEKAKEYLLGGGGEEGTDSAKGRRGRKTV